MARTVRQRARLAVGRWVALGARAAALHAGRCGAPPVSSARRGDAAVLARPMLHVEGAAGGRRIGGVMKIFVEESGGFPVKSDRGFEPSVLVGLIIPDRHMDDVDAFVADHCARWGKRELKAASLRPRRGAGGCEFIAPLPLAAVAHVTDTDMMSARWVAIGHARQVAEVQAGVERYRRKAAAN